jgi:hypothetical protein
MAPGPHQEADAAEDLGKPRHVRAEVEKRLPLRGHAKLPAAWLQEADGSPAPRRQPPQLLSILAVPLARKGADEDQGMPVPTKHRRPAAALTGNRVPTPRLVEGDLRDNRAHDPLVAAA